MGWFAWLRAPRAPAAPDLLERIEILEDNYARLERRFESLRGSVTGTLSRHARHRAQLEAELEDLRLVEDDLEDPQEDQDQVQLERDPSWRRALGAKRRFGKEA